MNLVHVPTRGPEDWKPLLAEPEKHWRVGYSAHALATAWEAAQGFPEEVRATLASAPALARLEPLLALPEHPVPLPGGARPSQNDIFVLARDEAGLAAITVEGKVRETFGDLVSEWFRQPTPGKRARLDFLLQLLGLEEGAALGCRYQLLHRTASAVLLAQRYHAARACMLVHSFSDGNDGFADYERFARALGVTARCNDAVEVGARGGARLFLAWTGAR